MDSSETVIKVNSSSLVSLKAELLRKEQEYNAEQQSGNKAPRVKLKLEKKRDGLHGHNSGVTHRAAQDIEEEIKQANIAKNSREILEKKARIYDAMAKGIINDDDNEDSLVNFHQKEYRWSCDENKQQPDVSTVISRSEDESLPTGPIHYANVQHSEIRSHGVGYFQFSEDNKKRQEQVDLLNHLRSQTEDQKAMKDRIKEKRQNLMAQRLAKMRQRRGLPEPPPEEVELIVKPEVVPLTRDDTWRQSVEITREWDKGKRKDINKSYLERCRDERLPEFAPTAELKLCSTTKPEMSVKVNPSLCHSPSEPDTQASIELSAPKMNSDKIDDALKRIRSETKTHGCTSTETKSLVVLDESATTPVVLPESNICDKDVLDPGLIPLPPTESVNISHHQHGHVTCTPIQTPDGDIRDGEMTPPDSSAAAGPAVRSASSCVLPTEVPWISVDTRFPPPSLLHFAQTQCVTQLETSTLTDAQVTSQLIGPPISTLKDPSLTTLFGAPAETASGTKNILKRHMAPQPAHYSSAPNKTKVIRAAYERINLHEIPLVLPAPPTETNVPQYQAQDSASIPRAWQDGKNKSKNVMHMWNNQFAFKEPK